MVTRHAVDPDYPGRPLCGDWTPDSAGLVETDPDVTQVDCPDCLEACGVHVCGISDPYPWCDGCRVMLSDAGR